MFEFLRQRHIKVLGVLRGSVSSTQACTKGQSLDLEAENLPISVKNSLPLINSKGHPKHSPPLFLLDEAQLWPWEISVKAHSLT